jgi:PIN domain nuclease of toxin-antitoxin system
VVFVSAFLLDTHVLIWAVRSPKKISNTAKKILENPNSLLYVSSITVWEVHMKYRAGKLPEAEDLVLDFEGSLQKLNAFDLAFTREHGFAAASIGLLQADPFDRALAARAKLEGMTFISADELFDQAQGLKVLW